MKTKATAAKKSTVVPQAASTELSTSLLLSIKKNVRGLSKMVKANGAETVKRHLGLLIELNS